MDVTVAPEPFDSDDARRLDDTSAAEVKRIYVEPQLRGKGIASKILEHLEAAARDLGIHRLVLETGIYQAEAIGLYRKTGFQPVRCWGPACASKRRSSLASRWS